MTYFSIASSSSKNMFVLELLLKDNLEGIKSHAEACECLVQLTFVWKFIEKQRRDKQLIKHAFYKGELKDKGLPLKITL